MRCAGYPRPVPGAVTDLLRPRKAPRPLLGSDGVLTGLGVGLKSGMTATDVQVSGVTHDSHAVRPGDLYAALPGVHTHGARYGTEAVSRGAVAVLTDPAGAALFEPAPVPVLIHDTPRTVLGEVAARVYGHPARRVLLIGVTGTNGKTTTTHLLVDALAACGHTTGLIGTVGTRIGTDWVATARTTPEATDVHALLAVMVERGVSAVAMEVSSHALVFGRVDGLVFDLAVFTGLSRDHLDFHGDLESYFAAKAELFSPERARAGLVCVDDEWGRRLAGSTRLPALATYGVGEGGQWQPASVREVPGGSQLQVRAPDDRVVDVHLHLPGIFNVANAIGAIAATVLTGGDLGAAAAGVSGTGGVPGRMERVPDPVPGRGLVALVDYAHTPDAIERSLVAARAGIDGRLVAVVGAGGDRDPGKRADMGAAAAALADLVVVTDDNPRSEDPAAIRAAVRAGASGPAAVVEIGDRAAAIDYAVTHAGPGDVVVVLGKGHEQGQETGGEVLPFDDRVELARALGQPVTAGRPR